MNPFAIGGVVSFVLSFIYLLAGAEITFKKKTGAGIVSIVIAYVIWLIRGVFEYLWIIVILYFLFGIALILYEPIRQRRTTKIIKIEEIIQLNGEAQWSLVFALIGVLFLIISTFI